MTLGNAHFTEYPALPFKILGRTLESLDGDKILENSNAGLCVIGPFNLNVIKRILNLNLNY